MARRSTRYDVTPNYLGAYLITNKTYYNCIHVAYQWENFIFSSVGVVHSVHRSLLFFIAGIEHRPSPGDKEMFAENVEARDAQGDEVSRWKMSGGKLAGTDVGDPSSGCRVLPPSPIVVEYSISLDVRRAVETCSPRSCNTASSAA